MTKNKLLQVPDEIINNKFSLNWTKQELNLLHKLDSPIKIHDYLDKIPYNSGSDTKSPRFVLQKKNAHCFEGAVFAAACLRNIGFRPLIVDMRSVNDDDHLIAVYKHNNCWGAVAKSNFTTLRFREPVYKSIRELCMSYFEFYFNTIGQKTLRAYSLPFDLSKYDSQDWMTTFKDLENIGDDIDKRKHYPLILPKQAKKLAKVRSYLIEAGLLGSNPDGLFIPKSSKSNKT